MFRTVLAVLALTTGLANAGPAENAATTSRFFETMNAGDMEGWIATMAPGITSLEPVGTPPIKGHEGVMAWAAQNAAMGFASVRVEVRELRPAGDKVAAVWTTHFTLPDGREVALDGVDVHAFDTEGRIVRIEAFFDPSPLMAAMGG